MLFVLIITMGLKTIGIMFFGRTKQKKKTEDPKTENKTIEKT